MRKRPDYTGATPEKIAKALFKRLKRGTKDQPQIQKRDADDGGVRKRSGTKEKEKEKEKEKRDDVV